jgi:hypothetical protein
MADKDMTKRVADSYNAAVLGALSGKKDYKNSDYHNIETYAPDFKKSGASIDESVKALEEAESEKKRESRRGDTKPPSTMDKIRATIGMKKGGSVSSASKRADGIAQRGKTKGTMVMCGGGMYKK